MVSSTQYKINIIAICSGELRSVPVIGAVCEVCDLPNTAKVEQEVEYTNHKAAYVHLPGYAAAFATFAASYNVTNLAHCLG